MTNIEMQIEPQVLQATKTTHILDDCLPNIEAACGYETNSTLMDILHDCKTDWDTLQNKTLECEKFEIPDCQCWKTVSDLKDDFQTKCFKGGKNSTGG